MKIEALTLVMVCMIPVSCSAQKFNNTPVDKLDTGRYLGKWYEIARFDHSFERDMHYAKATYTLNDDGTIKVVNAGIRKGKFKQSVGKAKLTARPGLLRVSFFGPFYSDYRVLMVADDYSYALVGSGSRDYLWILSRTPSLPDSILNEVLMEAMVRGYDPANLIWVQQKAPEYFTTVEN